MSVPGGIRPTVRATCPACGHVFQAARVAGAYEPLCGLCGRLRRAVALQEEARKLLREATEIAKDRSRGSACDKALSGS